MTALEDQRSAELRGVARAAGRGHGRDFPAGYPSGGFDHLFDRITASVAEVYEFRAVAVAQVTERQQVRLGKVRDVYIIADGGAVGGRVIVAEDRNMRYFSKCRGQHQGNEMGFGVVVLAAPAACATGIEIP